MLTPSTDYLSPQKHLDEWLDIWVLWSSQVDKISQHHIAQWGRYCFSHYRWKDRELQRLSELPTVGRVVCVGVRFCPWLCESKAHPFTPVPSCLSVRPEGSVSLRQLCRLAPFQEELWGEVFQFPFKVAFASLFFLSFPMSSCIFLSLHTKLEEWLPCLLVKWERWFLNCSLPHLKKPKCLHQLAEAGRRMKKTHQTVQDASLLSCFSVRKEAKKTPEMDMNCAKDIFSRRKGPVPREGPFI